MFFKRQITYKNLIDYSFFYKPENQEIFKRIFNKDHFLLPILEGTNNSYKKFIVIATQRTGSTLLLNTLRSHSNILCYSEIFKEHNQPLWGYYNIDEKLYKLAQRNPQKYLQFFFRDYSEQVRAVGFKLMYNQISLKNIKKILRIFDKENDLIIHLKRLNKLKMYVSHKLAESNGIYSLLKDDVLKNLNKQKLSYKVEKLYVDKESFIDYVKRIENYEREYDSLLKSYNYINMYYEDLEKNIIDSINQIIKKLNLNIEPLVVIHEKQNKEKLSNIIINYYDLKKALSNTKYTLFFEE